MRRVQHPKAAFLFSTKVGTLSLGLIFVWCGVAAQAPLSSRDFAGRDGTLKIFVLQGDGAINSIANHTAIMPVVEVRDANGQPVEGAEVILELPANGPGGFFANHESSIKLRTNPQGQAGAGFTPNDIPGRFTIGVTAHAGDRTQHANITQTNSIRAQEEIKAGRRSRRWKIALVGAAGAAVVGIILGTRSGHSGAPTRTITVSPGNPTVGAP